MLHTGGTTARPADMSVSGQIPETAQNLFCLRKRYWDQRLSQANINLEMVRNGICPTRQEAKQQHLCDRIDRQVRRLGRDGPTVYTYERITMILEKWEEICPTISGRPHDATSSLLRSLCETKNLAQEIRSQIVSELIAARLPDWTCTNYDGDVEGSDCRRGDQAMLLDPTLDLENGQQPESLGLSILDGRCSGIRIRSQSTAADSNTRHQYLEVSCHPLHELLGNSDFAWTLSHHHEGTTRNLSIDPDNPDSLYQDDVEGFFPGISRDLRVTLRSALSNHAETLTTLNQCFGSRSSTICRMVNTLNGVKRYLDYSVDILDADRRSH
jgi:hypothetical protein